MYWVALYLILKWKIKAKEWWGNIIHIYWNSDKCIRHESYQYIFHLSSHLQIHPFSYLPICFPIYLPLYFPIYQILSTFVSTFPIYQIQSTFLSTLLPTFLSTLLSTFLSTLFPTFLSILLSTFLLPSYISIYLSIHALISIYLLIDWHKPNWPTAWLTYLHTYIPMPIKQSYQPSDQPTYLSYIRASLYSSIQYNLYIWSNSSSYTGQYINCCWTTNINIKVRILWILELSIDLHIEKTYELIFLGW